MSKERIKAPFSGEELRSLKAGAEVLLSGVIYVARDQAHLRLSSMIERSAELPFKLEGAVVYYCGPIVSSDGKVASSGPTTSSRMDKFTPALLSKGLKGMIGKGGRAEEVKEAMKAAGAVYFLAPAGCGAYLSRTVVSSEMVAFKDLGPEAIRKFVVKDMPLVVGVDTEGRDIFNEIRSKKED